MGDGRGASPAAGVVEVDLTDTRERLLRAAFAAFVSEGFERARVQDIAAAAGFTTGAIYRNFESKIDLLLAVMRRYGSSFLEGELGRLAREHDGDTLVDLGATTLAGPASDLHRVLIDVAGVAARDAQVRSALAEVLDEVRSTYDAAIRAAQDEGQLDPALPSEAVVSLILTLMVGSFALKGLGLARPSEADARAVLERLVAALEPGPEPAS